MSKYTAEQMLGLIDRLKEQRAPHSETCAVSLSDLDAIDTLLRERESEKAGITDEMVERACEAFEGPYHWEFQTDLVKTNTRAAMWRSLSAVAPMLASARVPDEKEDLDPVRLRREGRVATEWERGFNEGWNACRDAMLAAAPKPDVEERHHWLCCGALKSDHSDKPRVMPDCFDPERHVWAISPKPETKD